MNSLLSLVSHTGTPQCNHQNDLLLFHILHIFWVSLKLRSIKSLDIELSKRKANSSIPHVTELWAEAAEERRYLDRECEHQRNKLVPSTEGQLCSKEARGSQSLGYNKVDPTTTAGNKSEHFNIYIGSIAW